MLQDLHLASGKFRFVNVHCSKGFRHAVMTIKYQLQDKPCCQSARLQKAVGTACQGSVKLAKAGNAALLAAMPIVEGECYRCTITSALH